MLARYDETLPELKDIAPNAPQPPEPPIEEREWQPPSRRESNLKYARTRVLVDGRELKQITVTAKPGRVIEQFIRYVPLDGGKDIKDVFVTRRTRGKPPGRRNGKKDHDNAAA
jgi:hypothetical protein